MIITTLATLVIFQSYIIAKQWSKIVEMRMEIRKAELEYDMILKDM